LEGRIFVPKLGIFDAAGESLATVRDSIRKKAHKHYPGLSFAMSLRAPRSFMVHVSEDVARPGPYEAQAIERVSQVIERAGGSGVRRNISILRKNGSEVRADLQLYQRTGDTTHNPFLSDGDVVRVRPRELMVRIEGAVRYPGEYELVHSRDLAELLELSGGVLSSASRTLPIRLIRRDAEERPTAHDLAWSEDGAAPAAALRDEDLVTVRSSSELQRSVLLIGSVEGADALDGATAVRRLPYVEGDTVRTIVERAGGIKAPGDLSGAYINRRTESGILQRISVDLEALLVRRDFDADRPVLVGDEIVVPSERRGVLVQGAVGRPGLYPYTPKFGVPEFIAHAGGRSRNARRMDAVSLVRPDGKTVPYEAGLKVAPGDAIIVPERNFSRSEIVSLVIAGGGLVVSMITLGLLASQ
jgi:protein involved in polysaccharide export with SLBB domain